MNAQLKGVPTEHQWTAIAGRDARVDGEFVYAVRTTGVYCRPSCAARTPRRENVVVFADPAEAEAAGFRACRRCRPAHPGGSPRQEAVAQARRYLDTRLEEEPEATVSLAELADAVGHSPAYLQRTFKQIVGCSPKAYQDARRVERVKAALRNGDTVLGATYEAGFGSARALYDRAPAALGMTPGTYRRNGRGERIRYAVFDTALGAVLIAATETGVCSVALGDEPGVLVEALHAEFSEAALVRDDGAVGPWAEPVLRYLAGAPGRPGEAARALRDVPLDLRGTDFQRRVWAVLRTIPPGETRTYGEVAAALGRPTASRAVARACASNRAALVVPCHRVVGAGGDLRGYRWGAERKSRLLDLERRAS